MQAERGWPTCGLEEFCEGGFWVVGESAGLLSGLVLVLYLVRSRIGVDLVDARVSLCEEWVVQGRLRRRVVLRLRRGVEWFGWRLAGEDFDKHLELLPCLVCLRP